MVVHLISVMPLGRGSIRHVVNGYIRFAINIYLTTVLHTCSFPDHILKAIF